MSDLSGGCEAMAENRLKIFLFVILTALPITLRASMKRQVVTFHPPTPRPGDVILVNVGSLDPVESVEGKLAGRRLAFYPHREGGVYRALGALPFDVPAGIFHLAVEIKLKNGRTVGLDAQVKARPGGFGRESLSPPIRKIQAKDNRSLPDSVIRPLLARTGSDRLWEGAFRLPLEGESVRVTSPFGAYRNYRGKNPQRHRGVDLRAGSGALVYASEAGRVAFVGRLSLSGNCVVVDHGLGLFTLYAHLSNILVEDGEPVGRGTILAETGNSGRSTGPHLHFGAYLGAKPVNPLSLIEATRPYARAAERVARTDR